MSLGLGGGNQGSWGQQFGRAVMVNGANQDIGTGINTGISALQAKFPSPVVYSFNLTDVPGVAAANRFLSLFRTAGSVVEAYLLGCIVESYSIAVSATRNSLQLSRITAASAGVLAAASDSNNYHPDVEPGPGLQVRTGNPTVTLAARVHAFAPGQMITAASWSGPARAEYYPDPQFRNLMRIPDSQGVALHQLIAGNVNQTYNITVLWAEEL